MAVNRQRPSVPAPARSARGRRRRLRAGFTLIEIVLAIALSTLVLLAAAVFVFSAFNLLTQTENDPGLEHHKLGVVGYLQYAFFQATPASNTTTGGNATSGNTTGNGYAGGQSGTGGGGNSSAGGPTTSFASSATPTITISSNQTNRVTWSYPPGVAAIDNPYISFRVDDDDPLLVWDSGPRPPATAWLYFKEGEGLSLVWQTDQQKLLDPNALQRTVLSPLVTKMEFVFYDPTTSQWSTADIPPTDSSGNTLLPTYIRLTFKINGKEEVMDVNLPAAQNNLPIY
jgi:prepilin-type N-terminal cleavage/methylation domain-containing protein